ncbi:MAG: pseudouridine-5'-phosphate glycosidase [Microthrixaceae bacterium]|nr:pseudouridine-5'-phosphate glycosidase [Microthrixaceae bacterium]
MALTSEFRVGDEVAEALALGRPVVALESTILSNLGLPTPHNRECFDRCDAVIRSAGAVPAVTAILDGCATVGLTIDEVERVLSADNKVSARDVAVAVGLGWEVGVTTVAASCMLAARAGVAVFATGGIGGVHRGAELSGDVSADLGAIARYPVVTVTAGAKAFLDLPRTVEWFDTLGVPVLGFGTDNFPAFYSRSSGVSVPHRVESAADVAAIVGAMRRAGERGGVVVANPIPAVAEIPAAEIDPVIVDALDAASAAGVTGAGVTPYVLEAIGAATEGRSIPANLALAEHNAAVGAEIARALAVS